MKTQTNKRKKQDTVLYTGHWVPSEKSFHHRDLRAIRVWGHFTLLEKYNTTSCKPHADTYHSFFANKQTSWPGVKMLVQYDNFFANDLDHLDGPAFEKRTLRHENLSSYFDLII